jgi:hypothetical protein
MARPKHKTCISILRSQLGTVSGGEVRFAKTIGRSPSWLKKTSAGIIPVSDDAAIRISYETGIAVEWILRGDTTKPPVDRHGNPYNKTSFEKHRVSMRESYDLDDAILSERSMYQSLEQILRIYLTLQHSNKGGLFAFRLSEAVGEIEDGLGVNFKKVGCQDKDICKMAQNFAEWIDKDSIPNLVGGILLPKKSKSENSKPETPTPQKKKRISRRKTSGGR